MLGVPREDWEKMFRWTNQIAGAADPEFAQSNEPGFTGMEQTRDDLFGYFAKLAEARLADPRDDIVSVLAQARIDGERIPPLELLSYFLVLVVAGNETTRNSASGGH